MNISASWLSDYVAHGLTPDDLAERLTMSGLEVEGVDESGPMLDGVVVGHVREVRPHPNADRLRICSVDLGDAAPEVDEAVQIVCGAPNVAEGQKVPVATVGTTLMLPSREDPTELQPVNIKKGKIRGEVSFGMICAEDELGIGDDHDGILVLDDSAEVGRPFEDYLRERDALPGDAVLDIAITPNRPDATSHVGVARDVAALLDLPLTLPEADVPEVSGEVAELASVEIEDGACPRFVGMVVRGVTVGPSPDWMQQRLRAIGLRPISNVVDVTNYIMMELGQPLHAYDLGTLAEGRVVVRRAEAGETFTTLDGVERKLPEGTVMVADANGYVGVAGVMGGLDSEVTDATTDVFIEGATWHPADIRRAAKALGLQTDASYRFERGSDPTMPPLAVARAAEMIAEMSGGEIVPGRIDENPTPYEPRAVTLRPSRVARVLGMEVPTDEIVRLLEAIGFGVDTSDESTEAGSLSVTVPPFRPDVEREVDVIEEVARLWGYDRLPTPDSTPVPMVPAGDTPSARLLAGTRTRLASLGFRELATNSLVPKATAETFADVAWTGLDGAPVETLNPISQEMAALRPSLLPGLLSVAAYNGARGAGALRLFEAGHVYRQGDGGKVDGYVEHTSLVIGMSGTVPATWNAPERETDFYDLKGVVTDVLADLGVDAVEETPRPAPDGLTAYALDLAVDGTRVGAVGRVSDALAEAADLAAPLFVAELDWDALAGLATRDQPAAYQPISRHPAVDRDLALVVPEAQGAGPLLDTIRQAGRPLLQDVRLFDVYRGGGVAEGSKSLAVGLTFAADRTLRDQEVEGRVKRIVKALDREHGATLRG